MQGFLQYALHLEFNSKERPNSIKSVIPSATNLSKVSQTIPDYIATILVLVVSVLDRWCNHRFRNPSDCC